MPNMIEGRYGHSSVAKRNKLFVIGNYSYDVSETCEIFDSTSKKFILLQKPNSLAFRLNGFCNKTFSIGSKLVIIGNSRTAITYDVEKDTWSAYQPNRPKIPDSYFNCALLPQVEFY